MDIMTVIVIGISLALDCFTVCVCASGVQKMDKHHQISIPLHFGIFQAGMLIIGYFVGVAFLELIENVDHWVAFILLAVIGVKMVIDSVQKNVSTPLNSEMKLISASIATSIDALAIGLAFSILALNIWIAAFMIGLVTYLMSLIGLMLGKNLRKMRIKFIGVIGGIVLIGIGIRILLLHLFP